MNNWLNIINMDALSACRSLPDGSVNCIVTSPPYWQLRNYLRNDDPRKSLEIGLEDTLEEYVGNLASVFQEALRALRDDGTLWLNLSDGYAGSGKLTSDFRNNRGQKGGGLQGSGNVQSRNGLPCPSGLKPKDLIGAPWRVAFALQSKGWYLRSDIIWHKPNPMPESVTDRPTRSHEYIFLLTKSERYYYDAAAIREPASPDLIKQVEEGYNGHAIKDHLAANVQDASAIKSRIINGARKRIDKQRGHSRRHAGFNDKWDALTPDEQAMLGANKRDVWKVAVANYPEAHFATYPTKLITPCILAGCPTEGVVFDPFAGSGTTGMVALTNRRRAILNELNKDYIPLIERRCNVQVPML